MVRLSNRRLLIDERPVIVLAGEVHYFRLSRSDWADRIKKTKEAGCNALASYIPWIIHEEVEGDFDLSGRKRPEHNVGEFIDMCHAAGLWFIARPGPFVMGEMKNEGIPFWVYEKCPDAIPTTWEGKKGSSKNLSYLHPDYLRFVKRWYSQIMPVLSSRLQGQGGSVIGVQLDNEIGMLQCWTGETDMSEDVLCDLAAWLHMHYSDAELRARYPFDLNDPIARAKAVWSPADAWASHLRTDYNEFLRRHFAQYASTLRSYAEEFGVKDVPFVINIHGSGGGRATTFPIGISQTFAAYTQGEGFWGASDHYLGELTRQNAGDLYFLNAFMAAVNRPEQPLSSMEFEAGTGDYGDNGASRYTGAAADFKSRLSVVQGNRLLNHYLLAGGHNPKLEVPRHDGNDRAATTGERHGFAAPIGPEGQLDPLYLALKETNQTLLAVADKLADMDEEHDNIALGFVPDYYATDVKHPGAIQDVVSKLEDARGPLEGLVRYMLDAGLSFPAVNLQAEIARSVKAIAFASSLCLGKTEQMRLVDFVKRGGNLLFYGRLPVLDFEGEACTVFADALGLKVKPIVQADKRALAIQGVGWARHEPELAEWQIQPFDPGRGEVFMRVVQSDDVVGASYRLGGGEAFVLTAEISMRRNLWRSLFDRLGASPAVRHDCELGGVLLNRLSNRAGERFISLINLDAEDKTLRITGFSQPVFLEGRKAKLLPVGVSFGGVRVRQSSAEIVRRDGDSVWFRGGKSAEWVEFESPVHSNLPIDGIRLEIPAGVREVRVW